VITPPSSSSPSDTARQLRWPHGEATLNALGAMLAPVVFRAPGHPDFAPLHIAPWAAEVDVDRWPPALARLRGDWPCVPFGRCDRPPELPPSWAALKPDDAWGHGYAAHHSWHWLPSADPHALQLQIDLPAEHDVASLTRTVRAQPDAAALDLELAITVRRACTVPVALHPTLRLDAGRVHLVIAHDGPGLSYPVPAEPGRSRIASDARFEALSAVPLAHDDRAREGEGNGDTGDFTHYPQPTHSEELLQLMDIRGPVSADYIDAGWRFMLDWDHALLPDLMLWISHGGRLHAPWNGRHHALGLEPVNSAFDLGRVATPPPGHALAARVGLALTPGTPCVIRSRLAARPLEPGA
jgi:hypothetical protein